MSLFDKNDKVGEPLVSKDMFFILLKYSSDFYFCINSSNKVNEWMNDDTNDD